MPLFAAALLDQAMMPAISAALETSGRLAHTPWQRATATAASAQIITAGHAGDRLVESQRLLRLHRDIHGVDPHSGLRYSALSPQAWHWIRISTIRMQLAAYTALTGHQLTSVEKQALWDHVRAKTAGLDLPGRPQIPACYDDITTLYETTVRDTLQPTPTVNTAIEMLLHRAPRPPVLPAVADPVWKMLRPAAGQLAATVGLGIMSPEVRAIVPMEWTRYHRAASAALILMLRWTFRIFPAVVTDSPLARNRREYRRLIDRYRRLASA